MNILLLQLDGKMPNLALMRIAAHHRANGDAVELRQFRREDSQPSLFDRWDRVYASAIFTKTRPVVEQVRRRWPGAVIGGTGWDIRLTLADVGIPDGPLDYTDYPGCRQSIGFTQRGCRLSCWFCVVPEKEGKVKQAAAIADIWRGEPWPREILLLDNDFFGQPSWRDRIDELRAGRFKVSFNQGINARMLSDEAAAAIASVDYRDDSMARKRIYTAWDSQGDEAVLFRGLNALVKHGVRPDNIMVYMLVEGPTIGPADIYRHAKLIDFGCRPYPMPYMRTPETLGFQRWAIRRADRKVSWERFSQARWRPERLSLL